MASKKKAKRKAKKKLCKCGGKKGKKKSLRAEVEALIKKAGKRKLSRSDRRYLKEMAAWLREQVEYVEDNDATIALVRQTLVRMRRIITLNGEQKKLRESSARDGLRTLEKFIKKHTKRRA